MKTTTFSYTLHRLKQIVASSFCAIVCLKANSASALVIDFDDLYYDPELSGYYDQPLENQYASYGITFFSKRFIKDIDTGNQWAFGLGGFVIDFMGKLTTHVTFNAFTESDEGMLMTVNDGALGYTSLPEPTPLILMGMGLIALVISKRGLSPVKNT